MEMHLFGNLFSSCIQTNGKAYDKVKGFFTQLHGWGLAYMPGVINPHAKRVQKWNKFFLISCLLAVFVDPSFFFILSVSKVIYEIV